MWAGRLNNFFFLLRLTKTEQNGRIHTGIHVVVKSYFCAGMKNRYCNTNARLSVRWCGSFAAFPFPPLRRRRPRLLCAFYFGICYRVNDVSTNNETNSRRTMATTMRYTCITTGRVLYNGSSRGNGRANSVLTFA